MDGSALQTCVWRTFAGRRMKFELRIGEIGELERLTASGIGEIFFRMTTLRFKHADVRESIRLGMMGAGETEATATSLVSFYVDREPIGAHLQLAMDILTACVNGVSPEGNGDGEGATSDAPATSSPSTEPAAP